MVKKYFDRSRDDFGNAFGNPTNERTAAINLKATLRGTRLCIDIHDVDADANSDADADAGTDGERGTRGGSSLQGLKWGPDSEALYFEGRRRSDVKLSSVVNKGAAGDLEVYFLLGTGQCMAI